MKVEQLSSNLVAEPSRDGAPRKFWQEWVLLKHFPAIWRQNTLVGSEAEPPENYDKNGCFRSIFQQFRGKTLARIREQSLAPRKILANYSGLCNFQR